MEDDVNENTWEKQGSKMTTVVVEGDVVQIPEWATDLESFRRWADSNDFPEAGRICYLQGEVWVDLSKEQLFSHLQVKSKFNIVLGGLAEAEELGLYFPDGLLLTNLAADLSWKPDGTFVSAATLRTGLIRLVEGAEGGHVELEGSPDMVLEVVSRSSVQKDYVTLRQAYWEAGIPEYWLIDAREEEIHFEILIWRKGGYVAVTPDKGWLNSPVFGHRFRLTRKRDRRGAWKYTLAVKAL